jgi:hypothetical protein
MESIRNIPEMEPVSMRRQDFATLIDGLDSAAEVSVSILPWRDWDYFEELAREDGGVDQEALAFWKSFPVGAKLKSMDELKSWVQLCIRFPTIDTSNGSHQIQYDFHLWSGSTQIAFNPELERLVLKRHSSIGLLLKPVIHTPWQP